MPDLQRIRRLGPGPQSFTRRQHHQQKPVGSCLTFQLSIGTDREPQYQQQLNHEPQQFGNAPGEPWQFKQQPQHNNDSASEPQHQQLEFKREHESQHN